MLDGENGAATFKQLMRMSRVPGTDSEFLVLDHAALRAVDVKTRKVTTIAGTMVGERYWTSGQSALESLPGALSVGGGYYANGIGSRAGFYWPAGLAVSPDGTMVAVADKFNRRARLRCALCDRIGTLSGKGLCRREIAF